MKSLLILIIKAYQYLISPWLGDNCRYHPNCSEYAQTAIEEHGALKGSWLAIKRLSRCHPFHEGGLDPVPPNPNNITANSPKKTDKVD